MSISFRKKSKSKCPTHISGALIPAVAFAAVPQTPPVPRPAGGSQNQRSLLSSSILSGSLPTQLFVSSSPARGPDNLQPFASTGTVHLGGRRHDSEDFSDHRAARANSAQPAYGIFDDPEESDMMRASTSHSPSRRDQTRLTSDAGGGTGTAEQQRDLGAEHPYADPRRRTDGAKPPGEHSGESDQKEHMIRQLREEIKVLQDAIYRLNAELGGKLNAGRPIEGRIVGPVGLPGKGPIPHWLVNTRYLNPLFAVYDERIREKGETLAKHEETLRKFEESLRTVVKENERLHARLEEAASLGPTSRAELHQFMAQTKLVMEENQVLHEQVNLQQEKMKELDKRNAAEVSRLTKQVIQLEGEKQERETELSHVEQRLVGLRARYEQFSGVGRSGEMRDTLLDQTTSPMSTRQSLLVDIQRRQDDQAQDVFNKMEMEHQNLSEQLANTKAERDKLAAEVKGLKKALKVTYRKNLAMRKLLKKEMTAETYLDRVVTLANEIVKERDDAVQAVRDRDAEYSKMISTLMEDIKTTAGVNGNLGKSKSLLQLEDIIHELLQQNKELKAKCQETDREIHYLQALLREKDTLVNHILHEKTDLEEKLESVWQSAIKDDSQSLS